MDDSSIIILSVKTLGNVGYHRQYLDYFIYLSYLMSVWTDKKCDICIVYFFINVGFDCHHVRFSCRFKAT